MGKYLVVCIVLLPALNVSAQNNRRISFDNLQIPGTLQSNPINDIVQDADGSMWFCSADALYRFNGYNFQKWGNDENLENTFPTTNYTSVVIYSDSLMYIGTHNQGLLKFNYQTYHLQQILLESLPINITSIIKDEEGSLVFRSMGNIHKLINEDSLAVIENRSTNFLKKLSNGKIYYSVKNELYELKTNDPELVFSSPKGEISTIENYNNSLWAGVSHEGVFNIEDKQIKKVLDCTTKINHISEGPLGRLWVLTNGIGLFLFENGKISQYQHEFYIPTSLISDKCYSILHSADNVTWIGTPLGISKFSPYNQKFDLFINQPLDKKSLSANMVRGICEDENRNLWIGTGDGTINILKKNQTNFEHINLNKGVPFSFLPYDNAMLVGTTEGLFKISHHTKRIIASYRFFRGRRVRQIQKYDEEHILLLSQGQVFKLNPVSGKIDSLGIEDPHPKPIVSHSRTIYIDQWKNIWVGTFGSVALVSPDFKKAKFFRVEKGDGHLVMFINRIKNNLWIGTFNGGLFKLDLATENFNKYTTEDGLPHNAIYSALPDTKGNLWISTNHGLSQFNIESGEFTNYDTSDGLQGMEFNRLAYATLQTGELVFGGINGLNIFHPDKIIKNNLSPKSNILSVEIINQFLDERNTTHPTIDLLHKKELELGHEQNFLRFNFYATDYSKPTQNTYYYKLENFDNDWVYAEDQNNASYTGLAPGKYTFKVKAINDDGVEEEHYASIDISIESPFWLKWWFYALMVSLVSLGVFAVVRAKIASQRALNIKLEKEVESRTQELKKSTDELSVLNDKKDFIFSILSHDLRGPLATLEGFLGILIHDSEHITPEQIKFHAEAMRSSVNVSLDLVDNILYWALSQMSKISCHPKAIKLSAMLQKVERLYSLTAMKKNITIQSHCEGNIEVMADENMLYIILRNLVSNAIKFTPVGKTVYIEARQVNDRASVTVKDEGVGISKSQQSKLFKTTANPLQKGTSNESGTGLGLLLCKTFVTMNGGTISVKSELGEGSTFTITLPGHSPASLKN